MLCSRRRAFGILTAVLTVSLSLARGDVSPASAQVMLPTLASYLRVDFTVEPGKGGRMRLTGYVYNTWDKWATDVRLLAEALDTSGQVVGATPISVYGKVPPGNRSYFDAPLAATGSSYRVTVQSADWRTFGAGGG
jgi:hypothetical protein